MAEAVVARWAGGLWRRRDLHVAVLYVMAGVDRAGGRSSTRNGVAASLASGGWIGGLGTLSGGTRATGACVLGRIGGSGMAVISRGGDGTGGDGTVDERPDTRHIEVRRDVNWWRAATWLSYVGARADPSDGCVKA